MMLSDGAEKAGAILATLSKYPRQFFIETGTNDGGTLQHVATDSEALVEHLWSIELDHAHYLNAIEKLDGYSNVTLVCADSGIHLPRLMDYLEEPCLLFLDAHAAEDGQPCPLLDELQCILHRVWLGKRHVVLIDDARLCGVWENWPSIERIKTMFEGLDYNVEVVDDIIRLEPR